MLAVRRRVERLEQKLGGGKRLVVLFANGSEATRECILRHGHDPDERGVQYVVVAWGTGDQNL